MTTEEVLKKIAEFKEFIKKNFVLSFILKLGNDPRNHILGLVPTEKIFAKEKKGFIEQFQYFKDEVIEILSDKQLTHTISNIETKLPDEDKMMMIVALNVELIEPKDHQTNIDAEVIDAFVDLGNPENIE